MEAVKIASQSGEGLLKVTDSKMKFKKYIQNYNTNVS